MKVTTLQAHPADLTFIIHGIPIRREELAKIKLSDNMKSPKAHLLLVCAFAAKVLPRYKVKLLSN